MARLPRKRPRYGGRNPPHNLSYQRDRVIIRFAATIHCLWPSEEELLGNKLPESSDSTVVSRHYSNTSITPSRSVDWLLHTFFRCTLPTLPAVVVRTLRHVIHSGECSPLRANSAAFPAVFFGHIADGTPGASRV